MKRKTRNLKSTQRLIAIISRMPSGLSHYPDKSIPFDVKNSAIMNWLIAQDDFLNWVFNKVKGTPGVIQYNKETNTWERTNE